MTAVRIIIALVLSVILLYFARVNSEGRPDFVTHTENGFTFEFTTVPKAPEAGRVRIPIKITGPLEPDLKPLLRLSRYGQNKTTDLQRYRRLPLFVEDSAAGLYYAEVTTGKRGLRLYYFFEIRDKFGGYRASLMSPDGGPFELRFIGKIPPLVLVGHIGLMATTVFFATLGFLFGIPLIAGKRNVRPLSVCFFLATLASLLGGYPLGFAMNHYAFDTIWEGVPFGSDVTDNKTQILFVYLLFMFLITLRSFTRGKLGRDLYAPRAVGWFAAGSFVLMLVIYFIPHSIQFTPALTMTVSYAFIGLVAVLYGAGWLRISRRKPPPHAPGSD
jgi:hypothetical protein